MHTRLWDLPVLRALAALAAGVLATGLLRLVPGVGSVPISLVLLVMGMLAALAAGWFGLNGVWRLGLLGLPLLLGWQAGAPAPSTLMLGVFGGLFLVFGGGILSRAPLYNSNRVAWATLLDLMPAGAALVLDLGAGLGGPVAYLARHRADLRVVGVEVSPLVWGIAWLRTARLPNASMRWGSLWRQSLAGAEVVYAFLAPPPMAPLWAKACREMRPGTRFISHTFEVPGVVPEQVLPLPGRPGACLRIYRIPG